MRAMSASQALSVVRTLQAAGARVYVGGGWGVDALLGRQTRLHTDLDLSFDAQDEPLVLSVLAGDGYSVVLDQRPVRFVMRHASGYEVDLHLVRFDATGAGVQDGFDDMLILYPADGFAWGTIAGESVPCFSAALQLSFHAVLPPREKDVRDMRLLCSWLGIALPDEFMQSFRW